MYTAILNAKCSIKPFVKICIRKMRDIGKDRVILTEISAQESMR